MRKVINNSVKHAKNTQKKQKWSPLRKSLNELDPRFDDMAKMMWRTPPLRLKDLQAQLKKEREAKKRQKSK